MTRGAFTSTVPAAVVTDRRHPFSTARYFDTHWFQSYESED
ncbi:hypothetical protein ACIQZB_33215 [Streptomyces sp. NPDC097727]